MSLYANIVALLNMNGNARDSSGNHNHGTVSGATLTTDQFGNVNSAYSFDGNDLITLVSPGGMIGQDMTLSAWIYPTTISGGAQRIFISSNDRYGLGLSASGLTGYVYAGSYRTLSSSLLDTGIALNTWTHVVMTYTANSLKIYSNGVLRNTLSITGPILTSTNMYIGNWSSLAQGFIGKISSPAMYNRALPDAEIQSLYNVGKGNHSLNSSGEYITHAVNNLGVDSTGLVGLYYGSGVDKTENHNHGTGYGTVSYGEDSYGNYVDINGNRNYGTLSGSTAGITVGNKMNFTQLTDFSWSTTFSILALQPNSASGVFGSSFDSSVTISNSSGAMYVGLRGSTQVTVNIGTNYWLTRLGEIHTVGFTYEASTTKFYVYLDGVLQNVGGTVGPTTFLTNDWRFGDDSLNGGNTSSCRKKIYNASVFSRQLSALEHLQIANTQQGKLSRIKGKTYVKHIDTNTALSVEMSQKKSILQSNSLTIV